MVGVVVAIVISTMPFKNYKYICKMHGKWKKL